MIDWKPVDISPEFKNAEAKEYLTCDDDGIIHVCEIRQVSDTRGYLTTIWVITTGDFEEHVVDNVLYWAEINKPEME